MDAVDILTTLQSLGGYVSVEHALHDLKVITADRDRVRMARDALLEACRKALGEYIVGPDKTLILGSPMDTVEALRAAIALCEGGQREQH